MGFIFLTFFMKPVNLTIVHNRSLSVTELFKKCNDLQYFYPGQVRRPHGYSASMAPWPIDKEGRDLSWYKNKFVYV